MSYVDSFKQFYDYVSRGFKASAIAGTLGLAALVSVGCASKPLPTNTIQEFEKTPVYIEENIRLSPVRFSEKDSFYVLPFKETQEGKTLSNNTIPEGYLIPADRSTSRVSVSGVGVAGGMVSVDSPGGYNFLPYAAEFNEDNGELSLRPLKDNNGLSRIVVPSIKVPGLDSSGKPLDVLNLTNKNFPFSTVSIGVRGEMASRDVDGSRMEQLKSYLVLPFNTSMQNFNDKNLSFVSEDYKTGSVLPYALVEIPADGLTVEFGGSKNPELPVVRAPVIVFSNKLSLEKYIAERGLVKQTAPVAPVIPTSTTPQPSRVRPVINDIPQGVYAPIK